jgi:hypothetical protein
MDFKKRKIQKKNTLFYFLALAYVCASFPSHIPFFVDSFPPRPSTPGPLYIVSWPGR